MSAPPILLPTEFAELDRHFAEFIGCFGGDGTLMPRLAAMLSRATREGNICLPLELALGEEGKGKWRSMLASSKAVGGPDEQTPLVIDEWNRLYLRRYWNYQQRLA
ncbi:MAG: exodeoxyribonuclease V subunit alpha, partial [Verrucomicrobiota bacterium]|nr:exodeoxyribonuclease V subunit alpha [Verrucomicrobiota bacterium]